MLYDAAIIGTGPAGISAALTLKIHEKSFIFIGTKGLSDKVEKAEQILNYPGLPSVSGKEMTEVFQKQLAEMGIEITESMVNSIVPFGDHYAVMAGSDFFEARSILLATGIIHVPVVKGETAFLGKGVSYCATCDGSLYRGKTIAVICNSARFEHEIRFLAGIAGKVYLKASHRDCRLELPNVERISDIDEICGEKRVNGIVTKAGERIPLDGVFVLRNAIAMNTLLPGLETEENHLKVSRRMETNLPGCFAAGDCTGRPYQYAKAVGEGNAAAHAMIDYLVENGKR